MADLPAEPDSKVIVAVGDDGRAYVPMADYEALRQIAERYHAALVGIEQLLEPLYAPRETEPSTY